MSPERIRCLLGRAIATRDQLLDDARQDGMLGTPLLAVAMSIVGDEIALYRRMLADSGVA